MKTFELLPTKGFNTTVNTSGDYSYWYSLFTMLMAKDIFAPMLIVMGRLNLVMDADCPWVDAPYAQRYAWIGEIMSDAEREEIYDAAGETGLLARGMNDFVLYALSSEERKSTYAPAVKEIISEEWYVKYLEPHVTAYCMREFF